METHLHHRLKSLAIAFLRRQGCVAAAMEVRSPIARHRVDAAGWCDAAPPDARVAAAASLHGVRREPMTIIVECKQSRGDFLRDNSKLEPLLDHRARLDAIRRSIEEHRIKRLEPQLRRSGTSLFPQLDEWDFASSRLPSYRRVLRRLARLDHKLHGETKFFLLAKYRLADRMYLAAPQGMIRPGELPRGWGLLECPARSLDGLGVTADDPTVELRVAVEAPRHTTRMDRRIRLLRNIAVAAASLNSRVERTQTALAVSEGASP